MFAAKCNHELFREIVLNRFREPSTWAALASIFAASISAPEMPLWLRFGAFLFALACAVAGIWLREGPQSIPQISIPASPEAESIPEPIIPKEITMPGTPSTLTQAASTVHSLSGILSGMASVLLGLFHIAPAAQADPATAAAHTAAVTKATSAVQAMATVAEAIAASGALGGAGATVAAVGSIASDLAGAVGQAAQQAPPDPVSASDTVNVPSTAAANG